MKHLRRPTNPPVISWFDDFGAEPNPYAFLSNFYAGLPLIWNDTSYATGEHLFAALKAATDADHAAVATAVGPGAAKSLGRRINLRPDWENVKYDAMALVLSVKFTLDRPEGSWLLDTGDALLVEGTWWQDRVWGVDLSATPRALPWRRPGRNWLGRLLMARRAELRAAATFGVDADYGAVEAFAQARTPRRRRTGRVTPMSVDAEVAAHVESYAEPAVLDVCGHDWPLAWADSCRGCTPFSADLYDEMTMVTESIDDALEGARAASGEPTGWDFEAWAHVRRPATADHSAVSTRIDHSECDHAPTRQARRRCRTRRKRA